MISAIANESDSLLPNATKNYGVGKLDNNNKKRGVNWKFSIHKMEGRVHIFGEWISLTNCRRYIVIGPDWPCVMITYIVIIAPSIVIQIYLVHAITEMIIFYILFGFSIFGLTTVFIADPGMVRKFHHARNRHWTYCDQCEAFRPPGTVHCSTCQVCVVGYDHHCPWTGKCVGRGNLTFFKLFIIALSWFIIYAIILGILKLLRARVNASTS